METERPDDLMIMELLHNASHISYAQRDQLLKRFEELLMKEEEAS